METIGIIATLLMLILAAAAACYFVYKDMTNYKAKVYKEQILPSTLSALDSYTDELMKKSMDFTKNYMKTLQEDL